MAELVIYEDGDVCLDVEVEKESIWLSQKQMELLFDKSKKTISKHINNIFKEGELDKGSVVRNFRTTAGDGKIYNVNHYNLDVVISVGYRVKSKRGTQFRIWATKVLKAYLIKGYALDQKKLQEKKLDELNTTIELIKQSFNSRKLEKYEAKGFLEIVSNYAKSWALLQGYDEQTLLAPMKVWEAYERISAANGSPKSELGALVGLVRYVSGLDDTLTPLQKRVALNFQEWVLKKHAGNAPKFSDEQMEWLRKIRDEIARSYRFETDNFELMEQGALAKVYGLFGDELNPLVDEMNEVLVG